MNKECENLALYFYGEMEPQQAAAFKQHLQHCKHCQQEISFMQQMQAALVPPAAPQALTERVLVQARPAPHAPRPGRPVCPGREGVPTCF